MIFFEENVLKLCEECGEELIQEYGSGEDEYGEFSDYECSECFHLTRFYVDKIESKTLEEEAEQLLGKETKEIYDAYNFSSGIDRFQSEFAYIEWGTEYSGSQLRFPLYKIRELKKAVENLESVIENRGKHE